MTEQIENEASDNEPVSKRTRRAGIVTSIGDPNLKDRTKVAPLFLTKKEKLDKQYKKETEKLVQSTKTRMNDWKSVIGVEKDATKVCPVFQRASLSSSQSQSVTNSACSTVRKPKSDLFVIKDGIPPLVDSSITPDPYLSLLNYSGKELNLPPRPQSQFPSLFSPSDSLISTLDLPVIRAPTSSPLVDLRTPLKPPSPSSDHSTPTIDEFPGIEKGLKAACIAALTTMSTGKDPVSSSYQISDWSASNTKDWNAARMEPRKQHMLSKWLAKWKDEDTAVRRNRVAPILLVSGPVGSGKTSLVYAAAAELNIQVLEVSPADFSWQSNGKRQISEAIREALQSRQVRQDSMSQIVLIDDVDVLVKEDKSVLNSIASITDDSKRPLVLTCTNQDIITGPSIVEVSEIFPVFPPTNLAISYMVYAYQQVQGRPVPSRTQCEAIAVHCRGDLRRLAIASQMLYLDNQVTKEREIESIPHCMFPVDVPIGPLASSQISDFIRLMSSIEGLPFNEDNFLNALSDKLTTNNDEIQTFFPLIQTACISDFLGKNHNLHSLYLVLKQLSIATTTTLSCEDILLTRPNRVSGDENFSKSWRETILPRFLTRTTITSIGVNKFKIGYTVAALVIMAKLSNSPEFNSRRLRCVLHQFGLDVAEIEILRNLRLYNN